MKRIFKDFATFVKLHDGYNRPRINFQDMYKMFPEFTFDPCDGFGDYTNFGKAFENKNLSMTVSCGGYKCFMVYKEYQDANENTAYVIDLEVK